MAVESRLTQAVLKEAKMFLHEETSNQGKDMHVGMPFRVPPTRWYEEKIKEFTAPSRETLIRQGDMRTKNQGPFIGEMNMFFYDAKFKKTLLYLENKEFRMASNEMLDSRWARQTPNRAKKLSNVIKDL